MKQQVEKQIAYTAVSAPLVFVHDEIKSRVTTLFDGEPVSELSMVLIKIWNSGTNPIHADDYQPSIKFSFDEKTKILDAEVWGNKVPLRKNIKSVSLKPLFLQKTKGVIALEVFLDNFTGEIKQSGGINGGKVVYEPNAEQEYQARFAAITPFYNTGLIIVCIATTLYLIEELAFLFAQVHFPFLAVETMLFFFYFGLALMLSFRILGSRWKRKTRLSILVALNAVLIPIVVYLFIILVWLIVH